MTWKWARSSFLGELLFSVLQLSVQLMIKYLYSCLFSLQHLLQMYVKMYRCPHYMERLSLLRQRRNIAHIQYNPFINDLCAYANTSFLEQLARSVSWGWAFVRIRTLIPLWVLEREKQSDSVLNKALGDPWIVALWVCILIVFERSLKLGNISDIYYIFSLIC